jgi:hypothetical protein
MKKLIPRILTTSLLAGTAVSAQTVIANAAADYLTAPGGSDITAPTEAPAGWSYFASDAASEGTEVALTAGTTGVGLAGNTGFGGVGQYKTPVVLGSTTNGAEFEIFADGFSGNANVTPGNTGVVGADLLLHPGNIPETAFVIVRYTINADDIAGGTDFNISGNFRDQVIQNANKLNANNWGSVDVFIYHNTTEIFAVDQDDADTTGGGLSQEDGTFEISGLTVAEGDTISFVVGNNGLFFGDETALQAAITQGSANSGAGISIAAIPGTDNLEITWLAVEGLSYNLRSSNSLSTDPLTWDIVTGQAGLDASANPIIIPRPADPSTFYVIESFED